jgi:hypothetical protein
MPQNAQIGNGATPTNPDADNGEYEAETMSRHILIIGLEDSMQARLDVGEYMFPEHLDDRRYDIECPRGNGCTGWLSCQDQHLCPHGTDAKHGPDDCFWCTEPPLTHTCYCGQEEFEFHGILHTWRYGWGWTIPFTKGCIVAYSDWEPPDEAYKLPIGEYEVEDDWDDDTPYLELVA